MKSSLVLVVGALLLLAGARPASAQIRWGHGRLPSSGACFYENSNFGGRYFCAGSGESLPTLPDGMGDQISSIRVFGNSEVTIFRDRSFRGGSSRFGGNVANLKREGWNDAISSLRIDRGRGGFGGGGNGRPPFGGGGGGPVWGRGPVPREGACFYEDSNFRGRYFCIDRGQNLRSLPSGFNDKISSVRVFRGGRVQIFADDDFRGRSTRLERDVQRLGSSWGDRISSIRVF